MNNPNSKVIPLLDADIIAYTVAAIGDKDESADLPELLDRFVYQWSRWGTETPVLCFSGRSFRYDCFGDYKAQRKNLPKPRYHQDAVDYLQENYEYLREENLEADDLLGIHGDYIDPDGNHYLLVSTDKDLRNVPGWHWNPDKERFPVHINEYTADWNLWYQVLTGDSTDGYKGLPGCGPVKAAKILDRVFTYGRASVPRLVSEEFLGLGHSVDYFNSQVQCARILRFGEYDREDKKPKLWYLCDHLNNG